MNRLGSPMMDRGRVLRFGAFELDTSINELRKAGALVKLQAQPLQLLVLLASRAGEVVTREEIRQSLWKDETFVDFDRGISFGINQIRTALRDDPRTPRFIETLPRKGYRFIAHVSGPESDEAVASDVSVQPESSLGVLPPQPLRRRRPPLPLIVLAALLISVLTVYGFRERLLSVGITPVRSIAVMPLANLSQDPAQEYFADGMTDELITVLAKIGGLRVVSRTSVIQYRGTKKSLPEIARELNVDAVLEGTVLRAQNRVRITAQLIRASPEDHLWAENYEGNLDEVLTLQDTVARAVADSIRIKLTAQEKKLLATPRSVNPEAFEAYLKGRYFSRVRTEENLAKSRDYFKQAVDKDPGYAQAWAGLAESWELLRAFGVVSGADAYPRVKDAAERALRLDDSLGYPNVELGVVKAYVESDWAGAEPLYKRAVELDPTNADIYDAYVLYLWAVGRPFDAMATAKRAAEVEPFYSGWHILIGWSQYVAHEYHASEQECRRVIEMIPNYSWGHICLASVYLQTGRGQQGIPELSRALVLSGHGLEELMYLGHDLAVSGERAEARKVLDELNNLAAQRYVPAEFIAVVYQGLGEEDHALAWFEKAYAERSMNPWIFTDPRLDPIRSDPRFRDLMRRMGLH